jgi:hypothetical protein
MIRNVTLITCEELRFEINHKLTIIGVFSGDIRITPGPFPVNKLIFLFQIQGDDIKVPRNINVQITLPDKEPRSQPVPVPTFIEADRMKAWTLRGAILIQNEIVSPGQVTATVIADGEEFSVAAPRIVLAQDSATFGEQPTASRPPSAQSPTSAQRIAQ